MELTHSTTKERFSLQPTLQTPQDLTDALDVKLKINLLQEEELKNEKNKVGENTPNRMIGAFNISPQLIPRRKLSK